MKQRAWTLVGFVILAAAAGLPGCSSADEPEDNGEETGGSAGSGAGTPSSGGSAGTPASGGSAGTPASGGSAGTPASGGSAGTAAGGTAGANAMCTGVRSNMPCPMDGLVCENLVCGLADSGRRTCNCATNWACMSCDYTGAWTEMMPATIEPCPAGVADEVACTTDMTICGPQTNGEYCACWMSPSDGQSWDCDSPPSTWGI
jgi:hypothetical protein